MTPELLWSLALVLLPSLALLIKRGFEWYSFRYRCDYPRVKRTGDFSPMSSHGKTSDDDDRVPGLYPSFPDLSIDSQREKALEYRERFGEVYFVWNLFDPIVVLSEPRCVADYFASQRTHSRDFGEVLGYGFSDIMGLMLGASDGSRYQRLHPLFAPFYREAHVVGDLPLIWNTVAKFFRRYLVPIPSRHHNNNKESLSGDSNSSDHNDEGNGVEVERLQLDLGKARFDQLPLTILVKLAFGDIEEEEEGEGVVVSGETQRHKKQLLQRVFDLYESHSTLLMECMRNPLTRIPAYRHAPTPTNRKIQKQRSDWTTLCEEQLRGLREELRHHHQQQQEQDSKERSDLFYVLGMKLLKEEEAGGRGKTRSLSWEELWHTLYEVTIFNIDITISELTHHLNNLAKHRDWQQRLRQQITQVIITTTTKTTTPTLAQLNALTLLDAFITESARLSPAVELSFPERLTEDQTLGDFFFPKGTCLCVDAVALNTHVEVWGSDATEFRPERFLSTTVKGDDGDNSNINGISKQMMHRFGLGSRRCMGYRYANVMIKCVLVHILQNYDVSLSSSSSSSSTSIDQSAQSDEGEKTARVMIPMLSPYAISSLLTFSPLV